MTSASLGGQSGKRPLRRLDEKGDRSLLNAGLVDCFRVVVFPVISGRTGRERIYDGYRDVALDMISSRKTVDA